MFRFIATAMLLAAALPSYAATAFRAEVRGGGGEPVILIPGSGSPAAVWETVASSLCGPRQCHVLTLAGFAGNPALADGKLAEQAVAQLADYIDRHRLKRPVVIGHSFGGFVGMKLAAGHADKVGRLIVVDTLPALGALGAPDATPRQLQERAGQIRARMEAMDPDTFNGAMRRGLSGMVSSSSDLERLAAWGEQSDRATIIEAAYDMGSQDLRPMLESIKSPTLVLGTWVAYQKIMPRDGTEKIFRQQYAALQGVRIEIADTSRHFIMYDDPDWLLERLRSFLD